MFQDNTNYVCKWPYEFIEMIFVDDDEADFESENTAVIKIGLKFLREPEINVKDSEVADESELNVSFVFTNKFGDQI